MSDEILEVLGSPIVELPFSVAVNGSVVERAKKLQCSICTTCVAKPCFKEIAAGLRVCELGVRFHVFRVREDQVTVYGLAPHTEVPKRLTEAFKGRRFPNAVVDGWIDGLRQLLQTIELRAEAGRETALDSIHDVSKLASEVSNIADRIFGDDLTRVGREELALVKSAELLVKEFERIELLVNPASAAAGRVYSHIYKLCHKYVQIIDLAFAKPNNKRVRISGRSFLELRVYESISLLVFSLIENAAKYAMSGEAIEVDLEDRIGSVDLTVTSVGPLIEKEELPHLFDRGFRGKWAIRTQHEGRGMGLYLAKLVAEAHRTNIAVTSVAQGYERNGIPCAKNTFVIRIGNI